MTAPQREDTSCVGKVAWEIFFAEIMPKISIAVEVGASNAREFVVRSGSELRRSFNVFIVYLISDVILIIE